MTPLLVTLVLTAALLHASWNAMAKSGGTPEFSIGGYQLVGALVSLSLVPFFPLPDPACWPMIAASVVIHNLYYFSLARTYRSGDLSQMYPLFRGLAPLLVAIMAAVFAGEWLTPGTLAGVVLISLGLVSLTIFSGRTGKVPRKALIWGLTTSVLIASYTIVDGLGVRVAGNPWSYILWLFVFEIVPIGGYFFLTAGREWLAFLSVNKTNIILGGTISSLAYGLVIFAMGLGAMAIVSSLRETSVIFAAVIGAFFLKEPFGRQRMMAATLVAIGIVTMRILS